MKAAADSRNSKRPFRPICDVGVLWTSASENSCSGNGEPIRGKQLRLDRWAPETIRKVFRFYRWADRANIVTSTSTTANYWVVSPDSSRELKVALKIRILKRRKSAGLEDLPPDFLKHSGDALMKAYVSLLRDIWFKKRGVGHWLYRHPKRHHALTKPVTLGSV